MSLLPCICMSWVLCRYVSHRHLWKLKTSHALNFTWSCELLPSLPIYLASSPTAGSGPMVRVQRHFCTAIADCYVPPSTRFQPNGLRDEEPVSRSVTLLSRKPSKPRHPQQVFGSYAPSLFGRSTGRTLFVRNFFHQLLHTPEPSYYRNACAMRLTCLCNRGPFKLMK